ncbi:XRE family transcriptional regulator [Nitrosovibrio sp. Nv4]|uniref:XRE family transcriptional regulator n=1 Tax=Nitrosovibrio sp. Nv4 TaxID=1945880 RepID=UPI000BD7C9A3|nr:XRE family transcriptional regulator [Nitrosovibrio sp. Nv4]SOD41798.1 DNA-binding transcriptional regulator, XRE-family HTH domain [Nitrosovibrio sp. Nv4]
MNIAKIIRDGRERLNLNQSQLAELVGVSPQAVQQWEAGATQPRGKRLNKIAQVLKLPQALMHFGASAEALTALSGAAVSAGARDARTGQSSKTAIEKSASNEKPVSNNDPLINQVVEAMRRMSKEDAARLVTISKALVGEAPAEGAEASPAVDLKPLPLPDMAPHPAPAFPARRMPETGTKVRGKTAVR